jgi:hypothetical protein
MDVLNFLRERIVVKDYGPLTLFGNIDLEQMKSLILKLCNPACKSTTGSQFKI